jgi:pimeloyl-ACP methyl ester carboxylesterase
MVILSLSISAFAGPNIQEKLANGELALDTEPIDVSKISYDLYPNPGKPWMILVHGLGGDKSTWRGVINDLSKEYQILALDQRGHGDNKIDRENFSTSTMAQDIVLLMNKLGIKNAHLVGHSLGGRTVIRFGAAYPERTLSVTVEDMHAIGRKTVLPDYSDLSIEAKPLYQPIFKSKKEFFKTYSSFLDLKTTADFQNFGYVDEKTGRFVMTVSNPFTVSMYSNQGLQEDLTEALKSIKAPITFLAASADENPVLFGKGIEHIKKNKPDARIVVFKKAGHSIHWDEKDNFVNEILEATKTNLTLSCRHLF